MVAAGVCAAGAVAGFAAVLAAGVAAAGAAGAAFCVTAGRDLELPMRLAWAMPGSTRPATAKAITEAEVRKEVFTGGRSKSEDSGQRGGARRTKR